MELVPEDEHELEFFLEFLCNQNEMKKPIIQVIEIETEIL